MTPKLFFSVFLPVFYWLPIDAQKRIAYLPKALNETSGLCFYNDSVLVTINDGGNGPKLFFLNLSGTLIHTVEVANATNIDWEDITTDGAGTLFIADIGNNDNDRKNLCIYKINEVNLLAKTKVKAEKLAFSYPDQSSFPPEKKDRRFDAEALVYYKDSLYIFTKCRAKPYDGISNCYALASNKTNQIAKKENDFKLGGTHWYQTSVTGACVQNNKLYLITYSKVFCYIINAKSVTQLSKNAHANYTQKEAIAVSKSGVIYMTDEYEKKTKTGGTLLKIVN
jgi:hypothetical protein